MRRACYEDEMLEQIYCNCEISAHNRVVLMLLGRYQRIPVTYKKDGHYISFGFVPCNFALNTSLCGCLAHLIHSDSTVFK